MHKSLVGIPDRILGLATDALRRANTDAVYFDRGLEYRRSLAPLSAAHAGELLLKALIAREHPLLLFKNIGEKATSDDIDLDWLLKYGRTHDFSRLPSVLWATSGIEIPDIDSFRRIAELRNQVQHFVDDRASDVQYECLKFLYSNVDPLLRDHFGLAACQFHDDDFDDYVVGALLSYQIRFTIPEILDFTEIDPCLRLEEASGEYRQWAIEAMKLDEDKFPKGKVVI